MRTQLRPLWAPLRARSSYVCRQCRAIQIAATPSTEVTPSDDTLGPGREASRDVADARFEVIGSPYSLLSVTLSASQNLYTRRGTLVALAGKPENTQSTLSILQPFTRAPFGIPFLYQRIASTSPATALIATKSRHTTFTILHLDGTIDWIVSRRNALVAWTGHSLSLSPRIRVSLPAAHWGSTLVTGRGLAALASSGHVYELRLAEGESFIAHPSHVVAYSVTRAPAPLPFRFRSSPGLRLQVPEVVSLWVGNLGLVREAKKSQAFALAARFARAVRTMLRRTIWGDRLFLHFSGPSTLLLSSRGASISDVLTDDDVNEIADAPDGAAQAAIQDEAEAREDASRTKTAGAKALEERPPMIRIVEINRDGKAIFEDARSLKDFVE